MRSLSVTASAVVSAMGCGGQATLTALRTRTGKLLPCDFADVTDGYIGRVEGLEAHRLRRDLARFECRNNRLADLTLRTDGFSEAVAEARDTYGPDRIAVILGTSTAGILEGEDAYRRRDAGGGALPDAFDYENTQDLFSLGGFVRGALRLSGPAFVISTACASSARSFVDAHHLIESGVCDAAVVGGVDSLCRTTLRGFAALGLISPEPCRPCDAARAGISIGEAGGFALLERPGARPGVNGEFALLGYGATSDGFHMSAPHPRGAGAIGAMRAALDRAGLAPEAIGYINLHGTGTRANDAMEDVAVSEVFGASVPCSSTKAWSGHTLGASGILEAVIAGLCIRNGFLPGCLGVDQVDPGFRANVITENTPASVRHVMTNSFGFGGVNCTLILGEPT